MNGSGNESQTIGTYPGWAGTAPAVVTIGGLTVTENSLRQELGLAPPAWRNPS